MSNGNDRIEREGSCLIQASENEGKSDDFSGPYLFVSFDLVNATLYKSQNLNWPKVFNMFMKSCSDNIRECISDKEILIEEWKRQGDEILFYIAHPNHEALLKIPAEVFESLLLIIEGLKSFTRDSTVQLSVKATLWSAFISSDKKITNEENKDKLFNIVTVMDTPSQKILDFLGPDIDTGFRIAKYASPGKLVVDACLAWYISKYASKHSNNIADNMRIVSLEDLKGVWNNRRYPIIWYNDKWADENDIFWYDEEFSSEIVRRIKEKGIKILQKIKVINKILGEVNSLKYAEQFENGIRNYSNRHIGIIKEISKKRAELHLVAICKNEENKILIFKRSASRSYKPNCWEFGCTHLKLEQNIFESLKSGYSEKYGITITIDEKSLPIGYYEIERGDLRIPGFIYHASVDTAEHIIFDSDKYSDTKWVDKNDALAIKKDQAVDDFHIRITEYLENS